MIPLLDRVRVSTNGKLYASDKVLVDIDAPEFTRILPYAEELVLYTAGEQVSANLKWGIFYYSSVLETFDAAPTQIGADVTTAVSTRHTATVDTSRFLPNARPVLAIGNATGSAVEGGVLTAMVGVKTVGL